MTKVIEGKEIANEIEKEIKEEIKGCIIRPSVAVIEVGNNPISKICIKEKEDACNRVGIYFRHYEFEEGTPELTIINKIKELNNDEYINEIVLQFPIPENYNEKRLSNVIINSKDIDGITDINVGRLISGRKTITPCTVLSILKIFQDNEIELSGKDVTIVGKGKLVGKPLINVLLAKGATVTICHSLTNNLKKHTKDADIIISAAGVKDLIKEDMIKKDAVVIDVGCSLDGKKIVGDVDFKNVSKKASLITKQPGGVGPLTVSMFLKNVLMCYNNKK